MLVMYDAASTASIRDTDSLGGPETFLSPTPLCPHSLTAPIIPSIPKRDAVVDTDSTAIDDGTGFIRKTQSLLESLTGLEAFLQGLIALASDFHKTDKSLDLSKTL